MEIVLTAEFKKSLIKLPLEAQHLYLRQESRFRESPKDPRLHLKKLINIPGVFSFRVTRRYRTLFYFQNSETAVFFEIGHRKDIYR